MIHVYKYEMMCTVDAQMHGLVVLRHVHADADASVTCEGMLERRFPQTSFPSNGLRARRYDH